MPQRLAQHLIARGLLPARTVDQALRRSQAEGGTLDTALLEAGVISEAGMLQAVSDVAGVRLVNLADFEPNAEASPLMPPKMSRQLNVVPLSLDGNSLHVASAYPLPASQLKDLGFLLGRKLELWVALECRVRDWQAVLYKQPLEPRYAKLLFQLDPSRPPPPEAVVVASAPVPRSEARTANEPALTTESLSPDVLERIAQGIVEEPVLLDKPKQKGGKPQSGRAPDSATSLPKPAAKPSPPVPVSLGDEADEEIRTSVLEPVAYARYAQSGHQPGAPSPTPPLADEHASTRVLDLRGYSNFAKEVSAKEASAAAAGATPAPPRISFPGGVLPPKKPAEATTKKSAGPPPTFVQPASAPRADPPRSRTALNAPVVPTGHADGDPDLDFSEVNLVLKGPEPKVVVPPEPPPVMPTRAAAGKAAAGAGPGRPPGRTPTPPPTPAAPSSGELAGMPEDGDIIEAFLDDTPAPARPTPVQPEPFLGARASTAPRGGASSSPSGASAQPGARASSPSQSSARLSAPSQSGGVSDAASQASASSQPRGASDASQPGARASAPSQPREASGTSAQPGARASSPSRGTSDASQPGARAPSQPREASSSQSSARLSTPSQSGGASDASSPPTARASAPSQSASDASESGGWSQSAEASEASEASDAASSPPGARASTPSQPRRASDASSPPRASTPSQPRGASDSSSPRASTPSQPRGASDSSSPRASTPSQPRGASDVSSQLGARPSTPSSPQPGARATPSQARGGADGTDALGRDQARRRAAAPFTAELSDASLSQGADDPFSLPSAAFDGGDDLSDLAGEPAPPAEPVGNETYLGVPPAGSPRLTGSSRAELPRVSPDSKTLPPTQVGDETPRPTPPQDERVPPETPPTRPAGPRKRVPITPAPPPAQPLASAPRPAAQPPARASAPLPVTRAPIMAVAVSELLTAPTVPPPTPAAPPTPPAPPEPAPEPILAAPPGLAGSNALEWSLAQARASLKGATHDRETLVSVILDYGRRTFEYVGAFAVMRGAAVGWDGRGDVDVTALRQVAIPLDAASVFRTVALTRGSYVGPLPPDALSQHYLALLGRSPRTVFLWPIEVQSRLVAMIYGDCGGRPVSQRRLADFILFCQDLPNAFHELILYRKQNPRADQTLTQQPPSMPTWLEQPSTEHTWTQPLARSVTSAVPPGDAEWFNGLITLLTGPDPSERSMAMLELMKTPDASAQALTYAFPGPTGWSRLPVVELPEPDELGPVPGAIARLAQAGASALAPLLDSSDSDTRYLALLTAGSLRYPDVVGGVLRGLFDLEPDISSAARAAASSLKYLPHFQHRLPELRQELLSSDPLRRSLAARALGVLHDRDSIESLINLTGSEDALCAQSAAEALKELTRAGFGTNPTLWAKWWARARERRRVEWLVDALDADDFDLRLAAIEELSRTFGDNFGYFADGPMAERDGARARWQGAIAERPDFDL